MRPFRFWLASAEVEMWDGADTAFILMNADVIYAAMVSEVWSWLLRRLWAREWP